MRYAGTTCVAAVLALGMTAFAQEPNQPRPEPSQPNPQTGAPAPGSQDRAPAAAGDEQQVTIVGCVQSESDYRQARDAGKGGVAGTGVGAGNEFVLINASMASGAPAGATGEAGSAAARPTGTAGVAGGGAAYELTGANEGQVASHVGKQVQIVGKLKAAEVGAAGATGGPTAGAPPRGVDVTSEDLKLRELEVTAVRETSGSCPAAK
jgi:hypothetical protein